MSLKAQITEDMKTAMRAKDSARLSTIRLLQAAMKQKEVDERIELDDAAIVAIIDKLIKQRKDSISAFESAGRHDLAAIEQAEMAVLQVYLPQRMSAEEVTAAVAAALMGPEVLEEALSCPRRSVSLEVSTRNIMSVNVPVFTFQTDSGDDALLPYGFAQTSGELDAALEKMQAVFADMLELAQVEKTMQLLAQDIEKTRRRVNALEYVMIPETEQNIRYITMKLDENERGNTTRLMKVKEMVLQDAHHYQP